MAKHQHKLRRSVVRTVAMPEDLVDRAYAAAQRLHTSITELIRTSLLKEVRMLEAQFEEEDRRRVAADAEKKRDKRSALLNPPPGLPTVQEQPDEFAQLYLKHARILFEVLSEPDLLQAKTKEAIAAIKRYAPLTHPSDDTIVLRLERGIREIQIEDLKNIERAVEPAKQAAQMAADPISAGEKVTRIIDALIARVAPPTVQPVPDPKEKPDE